VAGAMYACCIYIWKCEEIMFLSAFFFNLFLILMYQNDTKIFQKLI
jgi:hypothetical protein